MIYISPTVWKNALPLCESILYISGGYTASLASTAGDSAAEAELSPTSSSAFAGVSGVTSAWSTFSRCRILFTLFLLHAIAGAGWFHLQLRRLQRAQRDVGNANLASVSCFDSGWACSNSTCSCSNSSSSSRRFCLRPSDRSRPAVPARASAGSCRRYSSCVPVQAGASVPPARA